MTTHDAAPEPAAPPPDARDDQKIAAELQRLERKPPLYRFFRGGMYGLYIVAALWIVSAMSWSAIHSVWGPPGLALKARLQGRKAVHARPLSDAKLATPASTSGSITAETAAQTKTK